MDEEYEVIYTDLLERGVAIKIQNKLVLGIKDEAKESA